MFIELVDQLRCPRPHAFTWLVVETARIEARDIVTGTLGCPECGERYPIEHGVADFRGAIRELQPHESSGEADEGGQATWPSEEELTRLAALLDLITPGGLVVLAGSRGTAAPGLAATLDGIQFLAVDPPVIMESGRGVSIALCGGAPPLRQSAARAIALDADHAEPAVLSASVEALAPRGRLLAPISAGLPSGVVELARDEREWLAERIAPPSGVIPLRRA